MDLMAESNSSKRRCSEQFSEDLFPCRSVCRQGIAGAG